MQKKREKGFTLIELMIVVAIIGILAAVAIPKFADLIDRAREASTKGNLSAVRSAVSIYYGSEEGVAPITLAGLVTNYMSRIPGATVPFIDTDGDGDNDVTSGYTWADNAVSIATDYATAGLTDASTDGWAYDSDEPEVWIQLASTSYDTKGNAIYEW